VWIALRNGRHDDDLVHVLPELEAIAQFASDLNDRLAHGGVGGLDGTLELYRRLRGALERIAPGDVECARARIAALERSLGDVERCLDDLARLKRATGC
jgi:hypothetical protein